jgi:ABC-type sugar transport system ATPase subunit
MNPNDVVLEINHISKSFGVVQALKDVSFSVKRGEIHTLLGENGAGKSTLIKILTGEHTPDSGHVVINGEKITQYHPIISREHGISVVHQELSIFENLTVYENIYHFPLDNKKDGIIDRKELIKRAEESIKRFDVDISPTAKMRDLRLSNQQMVEILRALSSKAQIVLLDEPTSGLNTQETMTFMRILKQLRDEGITIIYISHRISEVMEISDRITVLRDGQYICTLENNEELTENILISNMVGRDFSKSIYSKKISTIPKDAPVIYEARNINRKNAVEDVSFSVRKGEILGIFGLEGSGTYELSRILFGLNERDSGEIYFKGEKIHHIDPVSLIERGMVYFSNNRKDAGIFFEMSIADNIAAPVLKKLVKYGMLNNYMISRHADQYIKEFSVTLNSIYDKPLSLSGGNQQKVMLSIGLGTDPELIIANDPTRGIDVGAKVEILNYLNHLSEQGVTIICFSSDLPELITLSDRILIMNTSRLAGIVDCDDISEQSVMQYAALVQS